MPQAPLTQKEITELAAVWYRKLDVHAPMVELLPLLADKGLEMVFPEVTIKGHAGFEGWFQRVIRIFFDEVHTVKKAKAKIVQGGAAATVEVVVRWEASVWNPPEEKSKRIVLDAFQTWTVKRAATGQAVIARYTVDKLKYLPGSAKL